jgi:hypothetical protein
MVVRYVHDGGDLTSESGTIKEPDDWIVREKIRSRYSDLLVLRTSGAC